MLSLGAAIATLGMALKWLFGIDEYIPLALLVIAYVLLGGDVIIKAARNIARGIVFDEHLLMGIATMGAFAIGEALEAVGVMLFYQVGEILQGIAVQKSKKSISRLMDIRPDFANLYVGGIIRRARPEDVQIGDTIIVKPGEKIPLDGVVIDGEAMIDTSPLTGESVPRRVLPTKTVLSGCISLDGLLTIKVAQTFGDSTATKIIGLVESAASKKAPTEKFITKFARRYTPAVVGLAAVLALAPPLLFGGQWADWLNRALIFLVISCPCALVISIPLSFFVGLGSASRKGVLIKGGNYLEALNGLDLVIFDKTGTLTKGVFKVAALRPAHGFTEGELLEIAARVEAFSNHPIALSIMREHGGQPSRADMAGYSEIAGRGISLKTGDATILAGNKELMAQMGVAFEEPPNRGTKVYVAKGGIYVGCIVISDEIRPDSRLAIASLKSRGIRRVVMLTGDDPQIAEEIAAELGIDEAHGGLLPQQKVEMVERLAAREKHRGRPCRLAFVGDGINDAPALAMADVGVAMGGLGSDAAIEAADIVLMTDEPSKLSQAVDIARATQGIAWQNICFALGAKALFLILGAFGAANMWEAVFADVGVAVLAILNSMRIMKM